ncbi:ADIPOR-like receptor CG5315 [Clonorchis sinensis]|uniref:ADIPOR-like receptor CG5315 n=1 Tax=Clonorchis sinensis TaxID=79923 RepID=G7YVU0_CLOSI|nr:ADIPOR-like receptor CG5315 [Clonorchis sinensis]
MHTRHGVGIRYTTTTNSSELYSGTVSAYALATVLPTVGRLFSAPDTSRLQITHRRMHSDGSAQLGSLSVDDLREPLDVRSVNDGLMDISSCSGIRKRKFQEFCLLDDSSSLSTSSCRAGRSEKSADVSLTSQRQKAHSHTTFTHRRCASHSGYLTSAAHELGEAAICAVEQAEELVLHLWKQGWKVVHHHSLPHWLKDNDFLLRGHRPQLPSFRECFRSIFRLHTETGNIWTHLIGFVCFLILSITFLLRPGIHLNWQEKLVVQIFFLSAILALGFSWLFHTVYCHSERVGRLFNKLDYVGIAVLVFGSSIPWLHYSFYCHVPFKVIYMSAVFILGSVCVVVCTQDYFLAPAYRGARAAVFIGLGLSAVVPCTHYLLMEGFWEAVSYSAFGWLVLMAVLYISGAVIYAARIPERLYPGKFDIWFQSHQIFHVFVVLAALVHLNGIMQIAEYRLSKGTCD